MHRLLKESRTKVRKPAEVLAEMPLGEWELKMVSRLLGISGIDGSCFMNTGPAMWKATLKRINFSEWTTAQVLQFGNLITPGFPGVWGHLITLPQFPREEIPKITKQLITALAVSGARWAGTHPISDNRKGVWTWTLIPLLKQPEISMELKGKAAMLFGRETTEILLEAHSYRTLSKPKLLKLGQELYQQYKQPDTWVAIVRLGKISVKEMLRIAEEVAHPDLWETIAEKHQLSVEIPKHRKQPLWQYAEKQNSVALWKQALRSESIPSERLYQLVKWIESSRHPVLWSEILEHLKSQRLPADDTLRWSWGLVKQDSSNDRFSDAGYQNVNAFLHHCTPTEYAQLSEEITEECIREHPTPEFWNKAFPEFRKDTRELWEIGMQWDTKLPTQKALRGKIWTFLGKRMNFSILTDQQLFHIADRTGDEAMWRQIATELEGRSS